MKTFSGPSHFGFNTMWTSYALIILSSIFIFADASPSLENLTFFGEYVVFRPKTSFIKFDLLEGIDILLLEHRTNKPSKIRDKDTLYRIRLAVENRTAAEEAPRVKCEIRRKGKIVFEGQYDLWNLTEKNNMSVSWGTDKRVIEVLTELDGNHNTIFSWKDRSKNRTSVKYVGLAVASLSPNASHDSDHRHLTWKVREAEPAEVNIDNVYRICDIKLLSSDPRSNSSNSTVLYQISITREDDENFLVTVQKRNEEVLRATSTRPIDWKIIAVSWDAEDRNLCFGQKNDTAPLFLWHDADVGNAFANVTYINIQVPFVNKSSFIKVGKENFKTIPEVFPRYFTSTRTGKAVATAATTTTTATTTAMVQSTSSSSISVPSQPDTVGHDNSRMMYD